MVAQRVLVAQMVKNLPACESAAFNMPANLENSTVATGLEKVSFHSNPKERQCQRIQEDAYRLYANTVPFYEET